MADTKPHLPADELSAAVDMLSPDSPVHAPGRARIVPDVPADEDGFHVLIAICGEHDDPDNPPTARRRLRLLRQVRVRPYLRPGPCPPDRRADQRP